MCPALTVADRNDLVVESLQSEGPKFIITKQDDGTIQAIFIMARTDENGIVWPYVDAIYGDMTDDERLKEAQDRFERWYTQAKADSQVKAKPTQAEPVADALAVEDKPE